MNSLLIEALPVAIGVTALGAIAFAVPALLALDLIFTRPYKTRPRPCQARAHDPRGGNPREHC